MPALDYYKKNVSLPDFLLDIGFHKAPRSTFRRPRLKNDHTGQSVEISLDKNEQYQYWDVHNIEKGVRPKSIIDAVIDHYSTSSEDPISFDQVRKILDDYIASENFVGPTKSKYKPHTTLSDGVPIDHYLKNVDDNINFPFLASRGFTKEMIENDQFKPIIKNLEKVGHDYTVSNVAFLMFNEKLNIAALSFRNFNFKGAAGSRTDSICASVNYEPLDRLYIGESMIDCMSYYFLNEEKLRHHSGRFISSEGELTNGQLSTIDLVIERQKPGEIRYLFDRDIAGEKFALKTNAHLINKLKTPFSAKLSHSDKSYCLDIESASDYIVKHLVNGLDNLNTNVSHFKEDPFLISDISKREGSYSCRIDFRDKSRMYLSSLNDLIYEYIANALDINVTRVVPVKKDFNQDMQAAILGITPPGSCKHFNNLEKCQDAEVLIPVLNNYSDNHHADFNSSDSMEYVSNFSKVHEQYNQQYPFLGLAFKTDLLSENLSPDRFISDIKKGTGLHKRGSFHFINPEGMFIAYFSTNKKFDSEKFGQDLSSVMSEYKIKKFSMKYLSLEEYNAFINQYKEAMTEKKQTIKAEKASEDPESVQEATEKSKYPVAYGWQNENEHDKGHPYYNFSIDKAKFAEMETDEYGNVHFAISLRKEPTEKGNCNVNIYLDDYHKTKEPNKYASLFVQIKAGKAQEFMKDSSEQYLSFSLGPVKEKDKFEYYVKVSDKETKTNEYVGTGITNKQSLIKSIPDADKKFLGEGTAKQFGNGSIGITVSIRADKFKDMETSPNGEYEMSLSVNKAKNDISVYTNTFRQDSIIDLDKIVSFNISKEQLEKADIQGMDFLSFDISAKKLESIKADKFDMSVKVFKSSDDKPYVGRAKTEVNFEKDISQILTKEKPQTKDQEKTL